MTRLAGVFVMSKKPNATKKAFALRLDEENLDALRRWADDELRSVNAQIEFVLRESLRKAGRLPRQDPDADSAKDQG